MKRKHSKEHRSCATDAKPVHPGRDQEADQVGNLEKQYEELCRLREQVQIEESRQRILGSSQFAEKLGA